MSAPEQNLDRLPERAEALLDGWPAPARGALEWEDTAGRTMARVRETVVGSTADGLLEAPLPEEGGEGGISPAPPEDQPMLANIARAVVAAGAGTSSREVAREMLRAAEEERRSAPPAPPSRRAYGALGQAESRGQAPEAGPVQAVHEASARSELPAREREEKQRRWGIVALGGGAALALAAGAALYVSMRAGDGRAVLAEPSAEAPRASLTSLAAPAVAPKAEAPARAIALDVLPSASEKSRQEPASPAPATGATKDSLAFRVKSASAGAGKVVLEERRDEAAPAQAAPTQAGPAAAAPNTTAAPEPAKNSATEPGLPPQPSLGAVQAAVGSVMTGARSCLAGQDSGSKATVKFGPTGRVMSIALSGPAAGTPAESCVRSALMGARVPPFSEPSFSASLTIRPP
jgi:hypothetical protein